MYLKESETALRQKLLTLSGALAEKENLCSDLKNTILATLEFGVKPLKKKLIADIEEQTHLEIHCKLL